MPAIDTRKGRPSKPRRKPTTTQRAKAQEQSYASQGRAVERAANTQQRRAAARPPAPAFRPIRSQTRRGAFTVVQSRQRHTREQALSKLPPHPAIPRIPVKSVQTTDTSRMTPQQIQQLLKKVQGPATPYDSSEVKAIKQEYAAARKKAGVRSILELYQLGNQAQRSNMRAVGKAVAESTTLNPRSPEYHSPAKRSATAGLNLPISTRIPGTNKSLSRLAPIQIGQAILEDMGRHHGIAADTISSSIRTGIESVAGIPEGVKVIATTFKDQGVKKGAATIGNQILDDYKDRYGSSFDNPELFRKRVQKEWGLTPFALDALAVAGGGGQLAGVLARTGTAGRAARVLQDVAETTRAPGVRTLSRAATNVRDTAVASKAATRLRGLDRRLEVAREDGDIQAVRDLEAQRKVVERTVRVTRRPNLRYSGGEGGVRTQETSRNLFVGLAQRGLDKRRARAYGQRVRRAGLDLEDDFRIVDRGRGDARDPRFDGLRPSNREVTPIRSLRENPVIRQFTGRSAREIGGIKSLGRIRVLTTQGRYADEIDSALKGLSDEAKSALKYQLDRGIRPGAQGIEQLRRLREKMVEARGTEGEDVIAPILRDTNDEVALIDKILAEPERYLPEGSGEVADTLRDIQRRAEAGDPTLDPDQARLRAIAPQAALLGLRREGDVEHFRTQLQEIQDATGADGLVDHAEELARLPADERVTYARGLLGDAARERDQATRALPGLSAAAAREAEGARLRESPAVSDNGVFNSRQLQQARERSERAKLEHIAGQEHVVRTQRVEKALRQVLDATRTARNQKIGEEKAQAFIDRVRKAAEEEGLADPAYWWSAKRPEDLPFLKTAGNPLKASGRSKRYTGALARIGGEDHDIARFKQGVDRNVKRRFQYAMVGRNVDTYAFEWSRGENGGGMDLGEIKDYLDRNHIEPESVRAFDANVVRRRDLDAEGAGRGRVLSDDQLADMGEQEITDHFRNELREQMREIRDLSPEEVRNLAGNRYLVVPKDVSDALMPAAAGLFDTKYARALSNLIQSKPTRIMLGAANVPWLAFQVASNGILSGLAGLNPLDIHGAVRWNRALLKADPEAHAAWEAEIGVAHGHHFGLDEANLGKVKSTGQGAWSDFRAGNLAAFWRAYKTTKVGKASSYANPLNVMFRMDEAQNNFFRKTLFYSKAKRQAYRRMGSSWRGIDRGITALTRDVLGLNSEKMLRAIAIHGKDFEDVAKHTNDFLGDYLRYSSAERLLLQRNVVFYGYLRFSLRFAFYTMPIQHPIMADILANVGRLGSDEIHELFGVPRDERLPTSVVSNVYTQGGKRQLPFGRTNPFLNTLSQLDDPIQLVGLMSPMFASAAEQVMGRSSFTGEAYRVSGSSRDDLKPTFGERSRIFLRDQLSYAYPYRLAEKALLEPKQTDDALIWSPRPVQYSPNGPTYAAKEKERAEFRKRSLVDKLAPEVLPFALSKPSSAQKVVDYEREQRAEDAEARRIGMGGKRKPRKRPARRQSSAARYGGGSSSQGSAYGGGSGTSLKARYGG